MLKNTIIFKLFYANYNFLYLINILKNHYNHLSYFTQKYFKLSLNQYQIIFDKLLAKLISNHEYSNLLLILFSFMENKNS